MTALESPMLADAEIWFDRATRRYAPGDTLEASYRLAEWRRAGLTVYEASVLWYTAGLGEEDFGVHVFQRRRVNPDAPDADTSGALATKLPPSPVSYDGQIVRVCWAARLRGFFPGGRSRVVEEAFWLRPEVDEPAAPRASTTPESTP